MADQINKNARLEELLAQGESCVLCKDDEGCPLLLQKKSVGKAGFVTLECPDVNCGYFVMMPSSIIKCNGCLKRESVMYPDKDVSYSLRLNGNYCFTCKNNKRVIKIMDTWGKYCCLAVLPADKGSPFCAVCLNPIPDEGSMVVVERTLSSLDKEERQYFCFKHSGVAELHSKKATAYLNGLNDFVEKNYSTLVVKHAKRKKGSKKRVALSESSSSSDADQPPLKTPK